MLRVAHCHQDSPDLMMGDFTKLSVWKKSHELTLAVYRRTATWPKFELFGLTSQTRRASYSIPSNIAEGCGRNSDAELARYARNSLGSASELFYFLILAHDLDYIARAERDQFQGSVTEVRRMLTSLERVSSLAAKAKTSARRRSR
jgi:four helix bundle protein